MPTSMRYKRTYILTVIAVFCLISFMTCFSVNADGTNIFVTFLLAVIFIIVLTKWKIRSEASSYAGNPNDARWSTDEEFKRAIRHSPEMTGGVWLGGEYTCTKNFHGIVIGGSGTGKTSLHLIPNLLIKPFSSNFVLDIKGELAQITAAAQKAIGNRFILSTRSMSNRIYAQSMALKAPASILSFFFKTKANYLKTVTSLHKR